MNHSSSSVIRAVIATSFAALFLSGCFFIPALTALQDMTAGSEHRAALLTKAIDEFHKEVNWGSPVKAAEYVVTEQKMTFMKKFKDSRQREQISGIEIANVDLNETAREATVIVQIKSFKTPRYIVETKELHEHWEFHHLAGKWLLHHPDAPEPAAPEEVTALNK